MSRRPGMKPRAMTYAVVFGLALWALFTLALWAVTR